MLSETTASNMTDAELLNALEMHDEPAVREIAKRFIAQIDFEQENYALSAANDRLGNELNLWRAWAKKIPE